MDTLEKKEKMTFKDYYRTLDIDSKKSLRDSFLERCNMPYPTFYSKLARNHFSVLEREVLEPLIKKGICII
jgi:chemotaxis methyl-accepting protein methylase